MKNQDLKNLDILTTKGQETLKQEDVVIQRIKTKWKVSVINTDKDDCASLDNLLVKDNLLVALTEIKCRDMSLQQMEKFGNTWLITNQKLIDGATASKLLRVPFIGILYLVPDDIILYWKITDSDGNYLFEFDVRETRTQRTVNGGSIIRENAYLDIKYSKKL